MTERVIQSKVGNSTGHNDPQSDSNRDASGIELNDVAGPTPSELFVYRSLRNPGLLIGMLLFIGESLSQERLHSRGTEMTAFVTAAMLYDLVACPHRVTMDLFADPAQRDEPNPFVELLWEKGSLYEREVVAGLQVPFLDLSPYAGDEKERQTLEAMQRGEPLIYGARIQVDGLLGDPDLLRKEGAAYIAGDIKSGSGEEGPADSSKPKIHYAVQLGLYTDILERKGLSAGRHARQSGEPADSPPVATLAGLSAVPHLSRQTGRCA